MMRNREDIALTAIYVVVALISIAAAVAELIRGDVTETGVDGLFLVAVCLLFAVVFGMIAAQTIRREYLAEWLAKRKARKAVSPAVTPEPQAEPVAQQQSKTAR